MSAVEKATALASVAASPLAKRRVLRDLGVPKSTYYRWLMRQQHQQGLEDRPGASAPPWNRLRPQEERSILEAAREMPELSSRQLAAWSTDNLAFAVSESTVYRILCREGLVKSPEMRLKAGKEYHRKTSGPHQMWATDASYFKVIGWGYYYLVTVMDDYSRFILYVSGKITEAQLDHQRKFITERLELLRSQLDELQARAASGTAKRATMEAVLAWAGEVGDGLDDMTPEQRKAVLQLVLDDAIIDKHNQVRINLAIPVEVPVSIASASSAWT